MNGKNSTSGARSRIYQYLYTCRDFCGRQDLADALGLSLPTIYQNLGVLMEEGLVDYSGDQRFTGGRRASGLTIVPDARIAVSIYITRDQLQFTAVDLLLNEIAVRTTDCPEAAQYIKEGKSLAQPLEAFLNAYDLEREKLLGVAVTLPAMLTSDGLHLIHCPTMGLSDIDLDGMIAGIPYPVRIENNGTGGGRAETFFRQNRENLAYLFLEDGVGGMLQIGGAAYNGDHNMSAEFGHICVHPGGLRCSCGRSGCLEAYCSTHRIRESLRMSPEDFFEGLGRHDAKCELLWRDYLQHLSIGIDNIHTIFDCDIVLGGYMIRYLKPYLPLLQEDVASLSPSDSEPDWLHPGIVEKDPAPRGAALYYIHAFTESV